LEVPIIALHAEMDTFLTNKEWGISELSVEITVKFEHQRRSARSEKTILSLVTMENAHASVDITIQMNLDLERYALVFEKVAKAEILARNE
jgi:hypothetical protein